MNKKALIVTNLAGFLYFLWNDIETLETMGYEVHIAANGIMSNGKEYREVEECRKRNIKFHNLNINSKNPLAKDNFSALRHLKRIISDNHYNVIHCHTPIAGIIGRVSAILHRGKGTALVYTTHGFAYVEGDSRKNWMKYYLPELIMSYFTDAIITINHDDYNCAQKMHSKKVYIIPGVGLDLTRFKKININRSEYRNRIGVDESDIMILSVGELSERKNHQIIIKAISKLPEKERYVYVICGTTVDNSGMDNILINTAREYGVRLNLLGHRYDIPEINACADIAAIPSKREGLGMAGLEALASGIPVVGSNVQGIKEYVIPGFTGYLCKPNSEAEFAEAIKQASIIDDCNREIMSKNCRTIAEKFSMEVSRRKMKEIYGELLQER